MDKLKKIIQQLSDEAFDKIESALAKNGSEKFFKLLTSYRYKNETEEKIIKSIKCNPRAFSVLKSRLLDKIQELLLESSNIQKISSSKDENSLAKYLYECPRETAIATLLKLEKNCISNDVPQELINVYSALKKIHFYSDKYYYYSQLYNKQVAYTIALEKAEDVLFNFNKTLSNYFFSRNQKDKELIYHFISEIKTIYSLNQSHRFGLIKGFILIQSQLFASIELPDQDPVEDLIRKCEQIAGNYINDDQIKYYNVAIKYFWLEYYYKIEQFKKAEQYLVIVNDHAKTWLLLNNYCLAFKFLITKTELFCKLNKTDELKKEKEDAYIDNYDFYTFAFIKFRKAIINLYDQKTSTSITLLCDLIKDVSLHHFLHFEIETKLTLAYLYVKAHKYMEADKLLKSLGRKINEGEKANYPNALLFIKMLDQLMIENKPENFKNEIQVTMQQFNFFNSGERKILSFLKTDLEATIKPSVVYA